MEYDVVIAGGGPAGATVGALVARGGYRVLILERTSTPSFKIGESLMPATYWTLQRLGLLDTMRESAFPVKGSVQFFSADGRAGTPFYFEDHDPHESSRTWQVLRSDFDQILLDHAAGEGAEIRRGVAAKRVLFEDDRATGVEVRNEDGVLEKISSRVIVDATGQGLLLARQLEILEPEPCLQHAAYFTHFSGALRDQGRDAGATLIFHTENRRSWFWFIPLPDDRVSVGVVGPVPYLVGDRDGGPERVFQQELSRCPTLHERLDSAQQLLPVKVIRDYSYKVRSLAGEGWVLAGDAAGFIDPIYSTGVFLALVSGEMAADAICDALENRDLSPQRLSAFEPDLRRGMETMAKLVFAFYSPEFSFGTFLERYPDCRGQLVDLLMGNVFRRPMDELLAALDASMSIGGESPS